MMVFPSLTGFKLFSGQGFHAPGHCDIDSIGIIYRSWLSMVLRQVYLGEISLKQMSRQDSAYARQTAGQTDNVYHNIIRPKVPSGVKRYAPYV